MNLIKLIAVFSLVIFAQSFSLASKSRLAALGQDKNGSLFLEDERNIFLNPGYIGFLKSRASFDSGATSVGTTSANSPKAEGGLIYTSDSFVTGVQLGRIHSLTENILKNSAYSTSGFFAPQNSVEVILGQGGSTSWGGSIHYAKSSTERGQTANFPDSQASVIALAGGLYKENYSIYANVDWVHQSETKEALGTPEKYQGKVGYGVGGTYDLDSASKVGFKMSSKNFDFNSGAGLEGDHQNLQTSLHYFRKLTSDTTLLFVTAGLLHNETAINYTTLGTSSDKRNEWTLPLSLGLEIPANDWLTLRSSITQSVLLDTSSRTDTINDIETNGSDDTTVAAGVSLIFNKLSVDATLEGINDGTGKINGVSLLGNVGFTYTL